MFFNTTARTPALALFCALTVPVWAQQTKPQSIEPLFTVNPTSIVDTATQTRRYASTDTGLIRDAAIQVLQDMGYKIRGGDKELGLVWGYKRADVPSAGTAHAVAEAMVVTLTVVLSGIIGENVITDLPEQVAQDIYVNLQISRSFDSASSIVRLSIDRDMIYDHGGLIPDHTELPAIYSEFFEHLSRSIFLEASSL